jgi:hypothetical protein
METDQPVPAHVNDEEKIRAAALDYIAGVLESRSRPDGTLPPP